MVDRHPKFYGKKTDKFGVSSDEAIKIYLSAKQSANINIVGVDMHIGSQILANKTFQKIF